jgi:hypothetical protein
MQEPRSIMSSGVCIDAYPLDCSGDTTGLPVAMRTQTDGQRHRTPAFHRSCACCGNPSARRATVCFCESVPLSRRTVHARDKGTTRSACAPDAFAASLICAAAQPAQGGMPASCSLRASSRVGCVDFSLASLRKRAQVLHNAVRRPLRIYALKHYRPAQALHFIHA